MESDTDMTLGRRDIDSSPNLEHLLQNAVRTWQSGNPTAARMMVEQVLENDKRNERAWLLMAKMANNEVDRRRYLETVLEINPRNAQASQLINQLDSALKGTESNSMRIGIVLVVGIIAVIIAVAVIALVLVR
jgi:thioredoxin-like negative regulator of GroEL